MRLIVAALALLLTACGQPQPSEPVLEIPEWAKVAPEQIAEAKKHGVPVAFENDLGMRFVLIPAGTFLMGSPEDEEGRDQDETQHEVTISKPFYMSIHEVTNGAFLRYRPAYWGSEDFLASPEGSIYARQAEARMPVAGVTWEDAVGFADWLSNAEDRNYRLPTEAEWEMACRAGTVTRYYWGRQFAGLQARSTPLRETEPVLWPTPAGEYPPNGWGLHDMSGNLAEWCLDAYDHRATPSRWDPVRSTPSGNGPDLRVLRGGGTMDGAAAVRCASRDAWPADRGGFTTGVRLVSPLPEEGE